MAAIERHKVYLRNVRSGEWTTTIIVKNKLSVNENDNPLDVKAAAEKKFGPGWTAIRSHRVRRNQT